MNLRTLLLFSFLFFANLSMGQDCPPAGTLIINSQAALDNFVTTYPNCTELPSSIRISGSTNLSSPAMPSQATPKIKGHKK